MMWMVLSSFVYAHSGGTDAYGCHAGSQPYHCHQPKFYVPLEVYVESINREAEERKRRQQIARFEYLTDLRWSEYDKCEAPRKKLYEYMNNQQWDSFHEQYAIVGSFDEVGCKQKILDTIAVEQCEIQQDLYDWPLGFTTQSILEKLSIPTNALRQSWVEWHKGATFYPNPYRKEMTLHEGFYLRNNFWIVVNTSGTVNIEYHELEENPFSLGDNFVGTIEGVEGTMWWLVVDAHGNGHKLQVKESKMVYDVPCHQIRSTPR